MIENKSERLTTLGFGIPIKDRENAELLIDSYKYAIELLTNAAVK